MDFMEDGNTLVEIQITDTAKDEQLDLGYAYLGIDGHSQKKNEKEILFNVLSSFQIKSVEKFEHEEREVWHIKLEYGVTY